MDTLCIKATISGKVQGVFFRQGTLEKARELNLTGWVKNLANGDVADPNSNIMMAYQPKSNPMDIFKDLKHLLRLSQIG